MSRISLPTDRLLEDLGNLQCLYNTRMIVYHAHHDDYNSEQPRWQGAVPVENQQVVLTRHWPKCCSLREPAGGAHTTLAKGLFP